MEAIEGARMNIILIGATGSTGSRILTELLARGHRVTAVVRNLSSVPAGVEARQNDLSDAGSMAALFSGADAVVSAYAPPSDDTDALLGVTERQIAAIQKAAGPRLLVVGGAGSLEVAPGLTLLDSGHLPEAWVAIAASHDKAFELLKASTINWTYFSPAAFFEPGERTGKFRLGTDTLIADEKQQSRISQEDYAIALVDELEKPAHERKRFTIGY